MAQIYIPDSDHTAQSYALGSKPRAEALLSRIAGPEWRNRDMSALRWRYPEPTCRAVYYAETGSGSGGRLIRLDAEGELRHQLADGSQAEHAPIRLPPRWYRQAQQHEYVEPARFAPPRRRRVAD